MPRFFQQQSLLGIHRTSFAGVDVEKTVVETVDTLEKSAPSPRGFLAEVSSGGEEALGLRVFRRDLGDRVGPCDEALPEGVLVLGSRETAGQTDDSNLCATAMGSLSRYTHLDIHSGESTRHVAMAKGPKRRRRNPYEGSLRKPDTSPLSGRQETRAGLTPSRILAPAVKVTPEANVSSPKKEILSKAVRRASGIRRQALPKPCLQESLYLPLIVKALKCSSWGWSRLRLPAAPKAARGKARHTATRGGLTRNGG